MFNPRGRGVQKQNSREKGSRLLRVVVEAPKKLTDTQKALMRRLADELVTSVSSGSGGDGIFGGLIGKKKK